MMTSYPVCNKTSLSRKPYIPDRKVLRNAIRKSWSLFQNSLWKLVWTDPSGEITMTSYPACNKSSLSQKPCIIDKKLLCMKCYQEVMVALSEPSCKIMLSAPWWRNHDFVISSLSDVTPTVYIVVIVPTRSCTNESNRTVSYAYNLIVK